MVAGTEAPPTPKPHAAGSAAWTASLAVACQCAGERRDRRQRELPDPHRPVGELTDIDAGPRVGVGRLELRAVERAGGGDERRQRSPEFEQIEHVAVGPQRRPLDRVGDRPDGSGGQLGDPGIAGAGDAHEVGGRQAEVGERDDALRGVAVDHGELVTRHRAEAPGQPSVERRLGGGPRRTSRIGPTAGRCGVDGQHDADAMGDGDAGARRAHEIELRRGRESTVDVTEGVDRGREVAADHVVDLLGLQQVRGGVDGDAEPAQHALGLAAQHHVLTAGDEMVDGVALAVGPQFVERETIEPAGGDRQRLLAGQGRHLACVVDRCVEASLVQVALDEVAEDGAETAAGPHPVEDALGQPHPLGGDRDRERVVVFAAMGKVGVAQQGGDLGLMDRRGVQETRIVGHSTQRPRLAVDIVGLGAGGVDRVGSETLDPAVPADQYTGGTIRAQLGESARGHRGGPRIHPVRRGVERPGDVRSQFVGARLGEVQHRRAEGLDVGRRGIADRRQSGPHGDVADRPVALQGPSERRVAEPEQLGIAFRGHRGVVDQSGRGGGVLAQPALADQRGQHGRRSFVTRLGDGVDIGGQQVAQGGGVIVAHERQLDRPGSGLVEHQRTGDRRRQPGGGGERLRPGGEREPRLRRHGAGEEVEGVGGERRAEGTAQGHGIRERVELQDLDEIRRRVAASDACRPAQRRPPPGADHAGDDRRQPGLAGISLEASERRHGQQAVRLAPDAEGRQGPARPHEAGGVIAPPGVVVAETAGADELGQPVAPRRRPHRAGDGRRQRIAVVAVRTRQADKVVITQAQGACRERSDARVPGGTRRTERTGVGARPPGRSTVGVVRQRSRIDEAQPAGEALGVEQRGERGGAVVRSSVADTGHQQQVDRPRDGQPERHADVLGGVEVDEPLHADVDGCHLVVLVVAPRRRRRWDEPAVRRDPAPPPGRR